MGRRTSYDMRNTSLQPRMEPSIAVSETNIGKLNVISVPLSDDEEEEEIVITENTRDNNSIVCSSSIEQFFPALSFNNEKVDDKFLNFLSKPSHLSHKKKHFMSHDL